MSQPLTAFLPSLQLQSADAGIHSEPFSVQVRGTATLSSSLHWLAVGPKGPQRTDARLNAMLMGLSS